MPDGRFRQYYWLIRTLLSEKDHLLDMGHPAYEMCEDDEVEYTSTFRATIIFFRTRPWSSLDKPRLHDILYYGADQWNIILTNGQYRIDTVTLCT